jgi:protocatechuate 3,4-dioxygenase, alpha subunit
MSVPATASQTVGPYFSIGLSRMNGVALCSEAVAGEHIEISGRVFDGNGHLVPDAQLELWQPDNEGRFAGIDHAGVGSSSDQFVGFARVPTDEQGAFRFHTVLPGTVTLLDGTPQAPHIVVLLSMRGLLKHLFTRIYFAGRPENQNDPILLAIPAERRSTLYAQPRDDNSKHLLWNIHLQGEDETVFFQY